MSGGGPATFDAANCVDVFAQALNLSSGFEAGHRACACCKSILFEAGLLKDGHVEIREWVILLPVEREMLTVLEAASSKQNRHVAVVVAGSVAEITGEQHRGIVEESGSVVVVCFLQ